MITVSMNPCEDFVADASKCQEIQADCLQQVLERAAKTSYGMRHGLDSETSIISFRQSQPLTTYEDYEEDIAAVVSGQDMHRLTPDDPTTVMRSRGCTGDHKRLPRTPVMMQHAMGLFGLSDEFLRKAVKVSPGANRMLTFASVGPVAYSEGGNILTAGATTGAIQSKFFQNFLRTTKCGTAPYEVYTHRSHFEAVYCHWVCALARRHDVVKIQANYAGEIWAGMQALEELAGLMIEDLRSGQLGRAVGARGLKGPVEEVMAEVTQEDVDAIEHELSQGMEGICQRLFPRLCYVCCVTTGNASRHAPAVRFYVGGGTPIVSGVYGSVESILGVNTQPLDVDPMYTMLPRGAFYEFILAAEATDPQPATKLLSELEVGQEYCPVITTFGGLYRYRMDDVLRVGDFVPGSKLPRMVYSRSICNPVSVTDERIPEADLIRAVMEAAERSLPDSSVLCDFTTTYVRTQEPHRLAVYWELRDGSCHPQDTAQLRQHDLEACANAIDDALMDVSPAYRDRRIQNDIGSVRLSTVARGGFVEMRKHLVDEEGVDPQQVFVPISLEDPDLRQILKVNIRQMTKATERALVSARSVPAMRVSLDKEDDDDDDDDERGDDLSGPNSGAKRRSGSPSMKEARRGGGGWLPRLLRFGKKDPQPVLAS